MREVDSTYQNGAKQNIRDVAVKIETNEDGSKTILSEKIVNVNIQRSLTGGSFSIGNTASDRLNATIIGTEKLSKKTRVTVSAAFNNSPYERIGRFYVDKCTRNGQQVTVTAFDAFSLAETEVKFSGKASKDLEKLKFPCTMQEMLDYIVTLKGMTCEFECQPFTIHEKPMKSETEYYTARELFGFIAGCHGCNAKMDYDGKLTFREFGEVSASLTADNVLDMTLDDFEPFTVKGVLFTVGDDSIYIDDVAGSEYDEEADGIVKITNPFASVEVAEYVWNKIGNLSYYGGSIKIRGAGILEPGDVVTVKNLKYPTDTAEYPVLITDISYSITRDGGFVETLSSAVSKKSSSGGGSSSSGKNKGSSILDQIKFTAGRAYYNGEEYVLQRGNNRRIIAVSKGDKCSIIDAPYAGSEAEAELEATLAILKGLDEKTTVEATYQVETGEKVGVVVDFDNSDGGKIDWGDGTVEDISDSDSHTYSTSGTFVQKITAPNATEITAVHYGATGEVQYKSDKILYIGGGIKTCKKAVASTSKMVIWGQNVEEIGEIGSGYADVAFPPFCKTQTGGWGDNVNYLYIPESCTSIGSMGSHTFQQIEIAPNGEPLQVTVPYSAFYGSSAKLNSVSLPTRLSFEDGIEFFGNCGLRYLRLESGWETVPKNIFYSSNHVSSGDTYVKLRAYIPKTVTKIENNAFHSPVQIMYEGSKSDWEKVEKDESLEYDISYSSGSKNPYDNFESDITTLVSDEANIIAGKGLNLDGGVMSLSPAANGSLGGVYTYGQGVEIDYDGKLSTKYASYKGGMGYHWEMGSVVVGEGLENAKDSSGNLRTRVCLGSGLKYEYPTDENGNENTNSYPVAIALNLGTGIEIDENGNVCVDAVYKAGEGIEIDEETKIVSLSPASISDLGGVKAGSNVQIDKDGKISTPGFIAADGIRITDDADLVRTIRAQVTNGLTLLDGKIAANIGEGLHLNSAGAIEADFSIGAAIVITNDESYKFVHNIEEVLYQDSDYEVLTGAQPCFILNREIVYGTNTYAPNGTQVKAGGMATDDWRTLPDIPFKQDKLYIFDHAIYNNKEVSEIKIVHNSSNSTSGADNFTIRFVFEDETTLNYASFNNFGTFSYGMAFVWDTIYPPGYKNTAAGVTFENGCVMGRIGYRYKNSASGTNPYVFALSSQANVCIGFASKEEYCAAMGLKTGSVDLSLLTDNPEPEDPDSGDGTVDTGDKYVSPTVSLERVIISNRGAVQIVVKDVLGTHSSYVYDGDIVKYTSQLKNDSGFVVKKTNVPFNVVAIPGVESVLLVWEKVVGASGYVVKSGDTAVQYTPKAIKPNSVRIKGLTGGTEYSFKVYAFVGTKWYGPSETVFATTYIDSTNGEAENDDIPELNATNTLPFGGGEEE